jgi:hypothetical protein
MRFRFGLALGLVLFTGAILLSLGALATPWYLKIFGILAGVVVLSPAILIVTWLFRRNRDNHANLKMETWVVAEDGEHNAFTDMIFWRDTFWLVYVSSPSHFSSTKSRLVLSRSSDARNWQEVKKFDGSGQDIRDPKLAIIQGQLFLYALLNKQFDPEPYKTIAARSNDGLTWSLFEDVTPEGWLVGRPITANELTWYAPAHRIYRGTAVLLQSTDGVNWVIHSILHEGAEERADETAIQFLKDGRIIAATRLEAGSTIFGSPQATTLISVAASPFTAWTQITRSPVTRLDGPNLFSVDGQVYALGRRQPKVANPFQKQGSAFSPKRTALFLVKENAEGLIHLTDFPSSGDTSYAGVAIADGKVFISYYTNDPRTDYPWLLGMLLPTRIQITEINSLPRTS